MPWRPLLLSLTLLLPLGAGETIRVAVPEWSTLNPLLLALDVDAEVTDLLFDRLVTLDAKGQFIPELLESWTILKGGREVVLKLRPGLTWQDGHPIEAEDVVFTWRALRLPRVREVADTISGVASLDHLTAEGPLVVRIHLQQPRGTLLSDLYNFIPVPRHLYQVAPNPKDSPVNFRPVGSGPYRAVGKPTGKHLFLERWAGYRGPHPGQASGFEFWDVTEERKHLLNLFQQERLHLIHLSNAENLSFYLVRKGAQGAGLVQALTTPQAAFRAYFLNCDPRRSLLGDPVLRRAIAELVPWQDLARARRFFPTRLARSFWPPESWAHDPKARPLPHPDRAAAILDAAGWKAGPDGIRQDPKGRRLTLVAYEPAPSSKQSAANLLAAQAAQVGVRIEVRALSFADLIAKANQHDGDLWQFAWILSLDPDVDSPLFTQDGLKTHANVSSYTNPEIDRLFQEGRNTLDPEARKRIYLQISEIIYQDKPIIPIDYTQARVFAHRRLRGVSFNLLGQSYGFWPGRRGWTLVD
jgi:peptide/nickel transport system substrate-binding protein